MVCLFTMISCKDFSTKESESVTMVRKGDVSDIKFSEVTGLYEISIENAYKIYSGLKKEVVIAFASEESVLSMKGGVAYFIFRKTGMTNANDLAAVVVHNHIAEKKLLAGEWKLGK